MNKMNEIVIVLLENVNDTHNKGLDFEKKSIDNKVDSIKEFYKTGEYLIELKIECKTLGLNFIDTLIDKTDIKEKSSQRYRTLVTDKRISSLIQNDNGDKLKGINNLGLMKLIKMSKLSDKDFKIVVNGDDTPFNKDNSDDIESDISDTDTESDIEKGTPDSDTESGTEKDISKSIPDKYVKTLGDEYHTLIKNDKEFLVLRISNEISKKQELEKEIVELKQKLNNLSPQGEV